MENGVAILWKNALQLSGKMSCKKQFSGEFLVFVANGIKIIGQRGLGDDVSQI